MEQIEWQNLLKRLQSIAEEHRDRGLVGISVTLYVVRGELKSWTRPSANLFEPAGTSGELLPHLPELDIAP